MLFVLLFARVLVANQIEKEQKQNALFDGISKHIPNLERAIDALERVREKCGSGKPGLVNIDIPTPLTTIGARLAELDPRGAPAYADYVSFAEIFRSTQSVFIDLRKSVLSNPSPPAGLLENCARFVRTLESDLIAVKQAELEVIRHIANKTARHDARQIGELERAIAASSEKLRQAPLAAAIS